MNHSLRPGPVTLYAQLANILRDRIVSGVWKTGDEIPTLEELVEEFSVARVTVRQAVQLLVNEKLVSSQRGRRTCVTFAPPRANPNPLYSSTGSIDADGADLSIDLLSKQTLDELPPNLAGTAAATGKYVRIRKVDSQHGSPYALSDNYVLLSLYKRFPANAEARIKLSRLVRDYAQPRLVSGFERITVGALNYEEATHLKAPIGSPVARVTRVFLEADGQIAYVSQLTYRADRFAIERDISKLVVLGSNPAAQGATPPKPAATPRRAPRQTRASAPRAERA